MGWALSIWGVVQLTYSRGPIAIAVPLLLVCGSPGPVIQATGGGIEGIAMAGPQCPAESVASACPNRPVSVAVTVVDDSGHDVTTFTSGADGRFHVALAPGTYTLVTRRQNQPQLLRPVMVTVAAGQYTDIKLFLDTGIR